MMPICAHYDPRLPQMCAAERDVERGCGRLCPGYCADDDDARRVADVQSWHAKFGFRPEAADE
jgi:hypothetical protein